MISSIEYIVIELSREVAECLARIKSLEKNVETQQNRSFINVNTFLQAGLSLIFGIIGAIILKFFL